MRPDLSFVVPFMNEEETLRPLFEGIRDAIAPLNRSFEVVFVDDGSTDKSAEVAEGLAAEHPGLVKLIALRGNFGKSAALAAGFHEVNGDVVFTMDADLQDDPKEIPRFLEELEKGFDLVSGYKRKRHDPITKVLPSRVFNAIVRTITGTHLHDVNCGFKAYRRVVIENVRLYGELHRFVPILAHARRFRIGEIPVQHHPRRHGVSKFGGGRFFRGLMDLLTVYFIMRYERRPAHFFGGVGTLCSLSGVAICTYLAVLWFQGEAIGHRPLLSLGILLIVVGVQFLATGLIGELLVHIGGTSAPYLVARVVGHEAPPHSPEPRQADLTPPVSAPAHRPEERA
jgi:glycosyltransferase involved in cell wall biosynthesis